jgi:hypothetical protein
MRRNQKDLWLYEEATLFMIAMTAMCLRCACNELFGWWSSDDILALSMLHLIQKWHSFAFGQWRH